MPTQVRIELDQFQTLGRVSFVFLCDIAADIFPLAFAFFVQFPLLHTFEDNVLTSDVLLLGHNRSRFELLVQFVLPLETLHSAFGVDNLLLAGVEGVGSAGDLHLIEGILLTIFPHDGFAGFDG